MIHKGHYETGLALEGEEAFPTTPKTALSATHASIVQSHRGPRPTLSPQMEQLGRFRNWMAVSVPILIMISDILQREYKEKFADFYGDRFPKRIEKMSKQAQEDRKVERYFMQKDRFKNFNRIDNTLYLLEAGYVHIDEHGRELLKDFERIRKLYSDLNRRHHKLARTLDDFWNAFTSEGDQVSEILRQVNEFLHDLDHFMIAHPMLTAEYARGRLERWDHARIEVAQLEADNVATRNFWIETMEKARTRMGQALEKPNGQ